MKNSSNTILEEYANIKEDKLNYDDYVGKGAAFIDLINECRYLL